MPADDQHTSITRRNQTLTPGDIVELFTIDVTPLGLNDQFRFTPDRTTATLNGVSFVGIDCEIEGFEWSGSGPLPQPKLRITNATNLMIAATVTYDDLVGALFIRQRTYARYLDDGAEPGTEAQFSPDYYQFEQKSSQDDTSIEWILASAMDQEGRLIPGRTIRRDTCGSRYRRYDNGTAAFDYRRATCPYVGTKYFDVFGETTTKDKDYCGKRLSDCQARFGKNKELPYGGFPGSSRLQR